MTDGKREQGKGHFLDLKLPLGGLLGFYGVALVLYGLLSGKEVYARSLGVNINLIWGGVIFFVGFGLLLAVFIKRPGRGGGRS